MDHKQYSSLSVRSRIPLELLLLFPPEKLRNAQILIAFIPWYKTEGLLLSQPACFVLQLAFLIYDLCVHLLMEQEQRLRGIVIFYYE